MFSPRRSPRMSPSLAPVPEVEFSDEDRVSGSKEGSEGWMEGSDDAELDQTTMIPVFHGALSSQIQEQTLAGSPTTENTPSATTLRGKDHDESEPDMSESLAEMPSSAIATAPTPTSLFTILHANTPASSPSLNLDHDATTFESTLHHQHEASLSPPEPLSSSPAAPSHIDFSSVQVHSTCDSA
eukprot:1749065-Rhodomonas_salina.1